MGNGKLYKLTAFILKRKNIGDGDKLLTVFSKESGKVRLIAKGIRKVGSRRASHLELFNEVSLMIHKGSSWHSVTEATSIHQYGIALTTLPTISYGYLVFEIIDTLLPDNEKQEDVYMLLEHIMNILVTVDDKQAEIAVTEFVKNLLVASGYIPKHAHTRTVYEYIHIIEGIIERKLRTKRLLLTIQ